jgi:hypothetical protein
MEPTIVNANGVDLCVETFGDQHGAQLDWAVDRRGTLARRVRRALDAVLQPGLLG